MKIQLGKKYKTRNGFNARVICVDCKGTQYPVIALVEQDNFDVVYSYSEYGFYDVNYEKHDLDLIEIPELEFDWSVLPAWANYIGMTNKGEFGWYSAPIKQQKDGEYFSRIDFSHIEMLCGKIPDQFKPIYHGDKPWAIFERPKL